MVLEVVRLAIQECIQLLEVRSIFGFAIGLGSMVSVTVDVKHSFVLGIGHVLAIIDLVELSLAISDFPSVSCTNILVLTEVRTDKRTVGPGVVGRDGHLSGKSDTNHSATSPSPGHLAECRHFADGV